MGLIALEGMRFHAYHGVYEAEQILGTTFLVDIYIQTPATSTAAATGDLANALNYETVFQIVQLEMAQPRPLIESVAAGIMLRMKKQFANMLTLKVRLRKLNPPMGASVAASMVEEEEQYMATCPRCQSPFINYYPGDCWARVPNIYSGTKETLLRQFGNRCLCDNCLKFFAG